MAYQKQVTHRALRLLSRNREELKQVYIDTYLEQTGYTVDQCELVETIQQVDSHIETTWFVRKREDTSDDKTRVD